jgi:hypothetical protein
MSGNFTITVAPDGSTFKVDVDGVEGKSCTDLTSIFKTAGKVVEDKKKAEYYIEETQTVEMQG